MCVHVNLLSVFYSQHRIYKNRMENNKCKLSPKTHIEADYSPLGPAYEDMEPGDNDNGEGQMKRQYEYVEAHQESDIGSNSQGSHTPGISMLSNRYEFSEIHHEADVTITQCQHKDVDNMIMHLEEKSQYHNQNVAHDQGSTCETDEMEEVVCPDNIDHNPDVSVHGTLAPNTDSCNEYAEIQEICPAIDSEYDVPTHSVMAQSGAQPVDNGYSHLEH